MEPDDQILKLLQEIRDTEREHLAEYKRVTQQLLEIQQRAAARQEHAARTYKRIGSLSGGLVAVLLILLVYLLVHWWSYLFR